MPTTAADLRHLAVSFASSSIREGGDSEAVSVAAVEDLAVAAKALAGAALVLARKVACTDAWRSAGHGSAADWFASVCGTSVYEASNQLRTAKALPNLPATADALAAGELSTSQARHVTEAATADPTAERELLDSARTDTHQALRDKAARIASAAMDPKDRKKKVQRERSKGLRFNADGSFDFHLHGDSPDGVRLQSRLNPYEQQAFLTHRRDGIKDTYDNRCYDAFFNFLADLDAGIAAPSGQPGSADLVPRDIVPREDDTDDHDRFRPVPSPSGLEPARLPKGGDNIKIIVRIDWDALARGHTIAGETCDIANRGPVTVDTVRDLFAEAFITAVVTKGKDVVNVAHLGRGCNAFQRTALEWGGIRCSNQACNRTIAIQMDHREPWVARQETKLDNQDPLCPECHRKKTHWGWTLAPGTGPRPFRPSSRSSGSVEADDQTHDRRPVADASPTPVLC